MQTLGYTTKHGKAAVAINAGVPLRKVWNADGYQVNTPMPGAYLSQFAGIATKKLSAEQVSSSMRFTEGVGRAHVTVPTAGQISSGPYISPVVGVNLLPYDSVLIPVAYNTGIRLLQDLSAESTGTYTENGGALIEIDPGVVDGDIRHLLWIAPAAASAALIKSWNYTSNVDKDITTFDAQPGEARVLALVVGGTDTDVKAVTVTVTGLDILGNTITDTFLCTVNTLGTITGTKAFAVVTRIEAPAHDGTGVTMTLGTTKGLGIPWTLPQKPAHILSRINHTNEGTAPTFTVDGDEVAKNFVTPNGSLAGTVFESWVIIK